MNEEYCKGCGMRGRFSDHDASRDITRRPCGLCTFVESEWKRLKLPDKFDF